MATTYFLMGSAFELNDKRNGNDLVFRGTTLSFFAAKKMIQLYADPYMRASIPNSFGLDTNMDTFNPRTAFFTDTVVLLLKTQCNRMAPRDNPKNKGPDVIPGMAVPSWRDRMHHDNRV